MTLPEGRDPARCGGPAVPPSLAVGGATGQVAGDGPLEDSCGRVYWIPGGADA
jgi:hypothetical protein